MDKLKSFVFYETFYENIRHIKSDKMKCDVLCRIIEYGLYGTPLNVSDIDDTGVLTSVVEGIKGFIDRSKANRQRISEMRRENGKKGGGQKGNQNARKYSRPEVEGNDVDEEQNADGDDVAKTNKNEQKRVKRVKRVVDVDVDVDGDVDGDNKEINNFISNAAAEEQIRKKEDDKPSLDYNKIAAMWNEICTSYPPVQRMTKDRKEITYQRISEFGLDYESIRALFKKFENSEFLRGKSWATYNWLFENEDNFAKVIEGQYSKTKPKSFAEANNDVNALWEKREREAELEWMTMHPNERWKDIKFDPSQFN